MRSALALLGFVVGIVLAFVFAAWLMRRKSGGAGATDKAGGMATELGSSSSAVAGTTAPETGPLASLGSWLTKTETVRATSSVPAAELAQADVVSAPAVGALTMKPGIERAPDPSIGPAPSKPLPSNVIPIFRGLGAGSGFVSVPGLL